MPLPRGFTSAVVPACRIFDSRLRFRHSGESVRCTAGNALKFRARSRYVLNVDESYVARCCLPPFEKSSTRSHATMPAGKSFCQLHRCIIRELQFYEVFARRGESATPNFQGDSHCSAKRKESLGAIRTFPAMQRSGQKLRKTIRRPPKDYARLIGGGIGAAYPLWESALCPAHCSANTLLKAECQTVEEIFPAHPEHASGPACLPANPAGRRHKSWVASESPKE